MKKVYLFLLLFYIGISFSQNEIKLTKEGVVPLVVEVDSLSSSQLYSKVKLYIAKKFTHPDYVTKADEQNKLLRYDSYKNYKGGLMTEGKYTFTCEIEFKEGKYRISFFNLRRASGVQTLSSCYNKDGVVPDKKYNKSLYENFNDLVNSEHESIKSYILQESKTSDW